MKNVKIHDEIPEYCRLLKLGGIAESFEEAEEDAQDYEEFLHRILEQQLERVDANALKSRIRRAKFPYPKYLEDLETDCLPKAMKQYLPELATLKFINDGRNLIMTGNPGTGKTHIAIGLGMKACEAGYKVLYTTVPLLVTELKECNDNKKLRTYERRFEKYDLVIADELGYISFDREAADLLFNCLSLRAAGRSTIVTSNLSFSRWSEIFGDPAITGAIVDRLTYKAVLVDMTGDSYRYRETLKTYGKGIPDGIAPVPMQAAPAEVTA